MRRFSVFFNQLQKVVHPPTTSVLFLFLKNIIIMKTFEILLFLLPRQMLMLISNFIYLLLLLMLQIINSQNLINICFSKILRRKNFHFCGRLLIWCIVYIGIFFITSWPPSFLLSLFFFKMVLKLLYNSKCSFVCTPVT